jgi:hypothetical protein
MTPQILTFIALSLGLSLGFIGIYLNAGKSTQTSPKILLSIPLFILLLSILYFSPLITNDDDAISILGAMLLIILGGWYARFHNHLLPQFNHLKLFSSFIILSSTCLLYFAKYSSITNIVFAVLGIAIVSLFSFVYFRVLKSPPLLDDYGFLIFNHLGIVFVLTLPALRLLFDLNANALPPDFINLSTIFISAAYLPPYAISSLFLFGLANDDQKPQVHQQKMQAKETNLKHKFDSLPATALDYLFLSLPALGAFILYPLATENIISFTAFYLLYSSLYLSLNKSLTTLFR